MRPFSRRVHGSDKTCALVEALVVSVVYTLLLLLSDMATRLKAPTTTRLVRPGGTRTSGAGSGIATPPTGGSAIGQRPSLSTTSKRAPPHAPSPQQQAPISAHSQPVTQIEVGDRVLVGGTKPGTVAFVGNTQFAKGVWAGLVLDTPEGKNDGSVAGVSYFQCPPNHGLFSRPEKLARVQKPARPSPAPAQQQNEEGFAIGDRILVDGVKAGVVAFVGPTQFAKGMWVGIALDAPEGKNDGLVAGVQYFECAPRHGIFTRPAKLTLVERPPPQRRLPPAAVAARGDTATTRPQRTSLSAVSVDELKAKAEEMSPGDRVVVSGVKVGTIRYLGPTDFAKGVWVGVELDGPEGKNNGSVSGRRWACVEYVCLC